MERTINTTARAAARKYAAEAMADKVLCVFMTLAACDSLGAGRLQFSASCCPDPTCWVRVDRPVREDAVVGRGHRRVRFRLLAWVYGACRDEQTPGGVSAKGGDEICWLRWVAVFKLRCTHGIH